MFRIIAEKTSAGEDIIMLTIIAETGSSPRSAGAHLLVNREGRICGTVGGGTVEYEAIKLAQKLVDLGQSRRKTYRLYPNNEEELGMICGGTVEIYFQYISGKDPQKSTLLRKWADLLAVQSEVCWIFIDLTHQSDWTMALYCPSAGLTGMDIVPDWIPTLTKSKPGLLKIKDTLIYSEPVNTGGAAFIFGAGHVGQALAPVLVKVGFRCVVFDNREELLKPDLFPGAADLILGDYKHIDEKIKIPLNAYIVIVTPAYDFEVLHQIISQERAYLGLIGSKTKIDRIKQKLREEGVSDNLINNINAPIGLPIRSETPEEIAISIAGEMILRRAERRESAPWS